MSTGPDQLSAIASRHTYNGQSDLIPECGHIENQERIQRRLTSQQSYDYNPSIRAMCTYPSLRVHLQH
jgi:hypothetical protein